MRSILLFLIVIFLVFGCTKVDENGFYLEGKLKHHHKETKLKYDRYGYDVNGFNDKGFNAASIHNVTNTKFDEKGFDEKGFDKNGFDKNGLDEYGFNNEGYNKKGFDERGFDKSGFNAKGFNRNGIHKITKTKYDENDYDCNGKKFVSAFEKKKFVDNFGDPTEDKYIVQRIDGVFSNSATDNSPAYISLIYTGGNCLRFDMYNYNRGSKAHFSSYEYYKYRLKDDSGNILDGKMYINTYLKGCLELCSSEAIEMVKRAQFIKVYIYEVDEDRTWEKLDTNYSFKINCAGFCRSIAYLNK